MSGIVPIQEDRINLIVLKTIDTLSLGIVRRIRYLSWMDGSVNLSGQLVIVDRRVEKLNSPRRT